MNNFFRATSTAIFAVIAFTGCSKPTDIVFEANPMATLYAHASELKKLPEADSELLGRYLLSKEAGWTSGAPVHIVGKTVGEVLERARKWETLVAAQKEADEQKAKEAEVLRQKVVDERNVAHALINAAVTLAVVDKKVSTNADLLRSEMQLTFAIENKGQRPLKLLKGKLSFFDSAGDFIGGLKVEFDEHIAPGKVLQTHGPLVWDLRSYMTGSIEKIASASLANLKTQFEPESLVFEDGTVLKAPVAPE